MAQPTKPLPPLPPKREVPIDLTLLTAADKQALDEQALKKVSDERLEAAKNAYLEGALLVERRGKGIEEELVTFVLELAEFADRIVLDSKIFFHGREYTVGKSKYDVLREIAYRTFDHQRELDGKKRETMRPQNLRISPHGVINTSHLMRA